MTKAALTLVPNTTPAKTPPESNISALARQYGVDRRTIRRWRQKGWAPPASATVRILPQDQSVPTPRPGVRSLGATRQLRRFRDVRHESGLPSTPDVSLRCRERLKGANSRRYPPDSLG
jgi:transposase-like protein